MTKRIVCCLLPVLMILPLIGTHRSDSFGTDFSSLRCSGGIVSVGDPVRSVAAKCGEPLAVTKSPEDSNDIWVYQFGASKFMYYLDFLNGKLQRIISAHCSSNDSNCYDLG